VLCTQLGAQLDAIGRGQFRFITDADGVTHPNGYSLDDLAQRVLDRAPLDKGEDSWRLRYAELMHVPICDWPVRAVTYAKGDAVVCHDLALHLAHLGRNMHDLPAQTRASVALRHIGARGLTVDHTALYDLRTRLEAEHDVLHGRLVGTNIYRANGTKDMAALRTRVSAALGAKAPRTATGQTSTTRDTLAQCVDDPVLQTMVGLSKVDKLLQAFIPALSAYGVIPCDYNTLVESGRTSCRGFRSGDLTGPNMQQLPRAGGVREVFVPRPGHLLCSVDYNALELRTLAQACLGMGFDSSLARAFRQGADPHMALGLQILAAGGENNPDAVRIKAARQMAKPANFGYPGGLGPDKFVDYARASYGVKFTREEAVALREAWRATWPEVRQFQFRVGAECAKSADNRCAVRHLVSERIRAACSYTVACNSFFQGLAADGAKDAAWHVWKDGADHGAHPVAFIHDEVLAEVPIDTAHDSAHWLRDTMVARMQAYCPDVPITAEPALADRWYKGMEASYHRGRLVAWKK